MTAKYIFDRARATTNTLLKGQLRMKVNISLVFLGAVAASAIALPAQAAVLTTTTNVGGTVTTAAYQVTGVTVSAAPATTFTIDFDHGIFAPTPAGVTANNKTTVYNGILPTLPSGAALTAVSAKAFGDAILAELRAAGVSSLVEKTSNTPTFGQDIKQQFYIPYAVGPNGPGENRVAYCDANSAIGITNCNIDLIQNVTGEVMYAKFTPATGTVPVPTPALIPGLLGMGLAAMRKKKQAAVAQEA
jgi:hypothetical protein